MTMEVMKVLKILQEDTIKTLNPFGSSVYGARI